jgi:nitrous oxidase accessory protein NosD
MRRAPPGDPRALADGQYQEEDIVKNGVVLYSQNLFGAKIIGDGRNSVITLGAGSVISGLDISRGRNGVVSSNTGAVIENCRIHSNQGSGILSLNRLPRITNSIISNNLGSGIQATKIGSTEGVLQHLTVAENRKNGLDIDGDHIIYLKDCIFYKNSNKAVRASNSNTIFISNSLFFPEQREFVNKDDLFAKPKFADKLYRLKDDSPGRKRAYDGRDIGFNK